MIRRRVVIGCCALVVAGIGAVQLVAGANDMAQETPVFIYGESAAETEAKLRDTLIGLTIDEAADKLKTMKGREPLVTDFGAGEMAVGTDLGDGIRSGDPVVMFNFGIRRGFLKPDFRVLAEFRYDDDRVLTELIMTRYMAK